MDADIELYISTQFEKIKLLRQTDKGEVWLGATKFGELVILKKINFVVLPYKILKENYNPLWAKIFFCAEDGGETFVAEEFLNGESLADRKNFLTETQAKNFLLQLCDGLKVLHGLGIVHRDIKPSNLILQNEKFIRLIDFDAARIFKADKSEDTKFLGTKGYAPPEQFGYGQTDSRSDIYSLGVTFQKLLGDNCKGNLKKILSKCAELDPKNRFQSVEELKFALLEKKSAPFKKIFSTLILSLFIIFLFQKSTSEKNIPQPVEIEKVPEVEKVEEKILPKKIPEVEQKKFQFPEIKFPESPAPTSTTLPVEVPEVQIQPAEKKSPPVEPEKKIYKDYVKVTYYYNGERRFSWVDNFNHDIYNAGWQNEVTSLENFQKVGESFKFPAWKIDVKVENLTDKNFFNPQLEIVYNDNGRIEKKILQGATIPAGGEKIFTINLNQFAVTDPNAAGDSYRSLHNFKLKFTGTGAKIFGSAAFCDFVFNFK